MTAPKSTSLYWLYPALWGIMMYNVLRAITDLAKKDTFWSGDLQTHLVPSAFSILVCYLFYVNWRYRLKKGRYLSGASASVMQEYLLVLAEIVFPFNFLLIFGQWAGLFSMGAGWIDYMLINVAYLPLLLLFYTLTRNNEVNKYVQHQSILLERMRVEQYETELKFLKSQYHPHFLFNALNTIYFQIDETNQEAKQTIELLSDLLRYQLYDINKKVAISQEIRYIQAYIAFQKLRKSEKLTLQTTIDINLNRQLVHPLLFQPLLENAFKYVGGSQQINLDMQLTGHKISVRVSNAVSATKPSGDVKDRGLGIENLKRRLDLLYADAYRLDTREADGFFIATLTIPFYGN